jgi:hypothetical protein
VSSCTPTTEVPASERPLALDADGQPVSVSCEAPSGPGVHQVACVATDGAGRTASTTITVTVLAGLRVAFQSPLEDDGVRDDIAADTDVHNKFKVGATVVHKVKLYACDGDDVTQALQASVTVRLQVTERDQATDALVADVPETFAGAGGPGGLMVPGAGVFQYNLKTTGYEAGTVDSARYFQSRVTVAYDSHPTITVGDEDAALDSKR